MMLPAGGRCEKETVGYQRSEEEALRTGQELVQFYHQWGLRQPRDSETVLAATLLQN
jgi:hypothetical protein